MGAEFMLEMIRGFGDGLVRNALHGESFYATHRALEKVKMMNMITPSPNRPYSLALAERQYSEVIMYSLNSEVTRPIAVLNNFQEGPEFLQPKRNA